MRTGRAQPALGAQKLNADGPSGPLLFGSRDTTMCRSGFPVAMSHPSDLRPEPDKLQAALEASCGALMTLQAIDRSAAAGAGEGHALHEHLVRAIESLRSAIAELRLAHDNQASMVGLGFVAEGQPPPLPGKPNASRQASPRRTA